jgi:hypothetical protein
MFLKHYFYATLILCSSAFPAFVGQLFPPANIGAGPNVSCPNGEVLAWTGDAVNCTNPTPGVTASCAAGQVLTGISAGAPVCKSVPTCPAGETLNFNGTNFVCNASTMPTCGANQVLTYNGSAFVGVNKDPSIPTCAAGQFLTYNGLSFQCAGTQNVSIPTCGANQYVTANGSQFSCAALPSSGGASIEGEWCGTFWAVSDDYGDRWQGCPCGSAGFKDWLAIPPNNPGCPAGWIMIWVGTASSGVTTCMKE